MTEFRLVSFNPNRNSKIVCIHHTDTNREIVERVRNNFIDAERRFTPPGNLRNAFYFVLTDDQLPTWFLQPSHK